ncbi:MAG: hypothetical protein KDN22_04570 [Verrucomicrobiae bacterium]|nr:hypothetical protein [Verrucomicrobiae bacterium]
MTSYRPALIPLSIVCFLSGAVVSPVCAETIFVEDFDGLEASQLPWESATESGGDGSDWTKEPPAGWVIDNDGVPGGGVIEFEGWTFLDPVSWDETAQQGRSAFTKGQGVIAVADGDEWDDAGPGARMETLLTTPAISIAENSPNSIVLQFDSSWNAEPQTGIVTVTFDGGDPVELLRYDADTPTLIDETLFLPIENPAGASSMTISFSYEAGNNWWWAIDNIKVLADEVTIVTQPVGRDVLAGDTVALSVKAHGGNLSYQWYKMGSEGARQPIPGATASELVLPSITVDQAGTYSVEVNNDKGSDALSESVMISVLEVAQTTILWSENFDQSPLGPTVDEGVPLANAWTDTPPEGWSVDDSGVPGFDSEDANGDGHPDLDGVTEWAGWSFANRDWWAATAGDQQRTQFTRCCGVAMIVDPDEWDDLDHPAKATWSRPIQDDEGFDASVTTRAISIAGSEEESVFLRFDSSWRPYDQMIASITATFDDAAPVEIFRRESFSETGGDPYFSNQTVPPVADPIPDQLTNEVVTIPIENPEGATSVKFTFSLKKAHNDWWWAVDNLLLFAGVAPPAILDPPVGGQIISGETAELSVGLDPGSSVGEPSFQWLKRERGGVVANPIEGATGATLQIPDAQQSDTGFYSVVVSNQAGGVTTCEAELIVGPLILQDQPQDLTISAGDEACFFVTPIGRSPFSYKWFKGTGDDRKELFNGVSISGATTFELLIESTVLNDSGIYSVEVSNQFGTVASMEATLAVVPILPVSELVSTSGRAGGEARLSILVDGEEPLTYEWRYRPLGSNADPEVIEGAVGSELMLMNLKVEDTGLYSVKVSNGFGEYISQEAKVTVNPMPGPNVIFLEDFDSLALSEPIDEGLFEDEVWTGTPPAGWSLDNSGVPGIDSPDDDGDGYPDQDGVTEWAGWGFANKDWWVATAGDQQRSDWLSGANTVAIMDPDEWDDATHAAGTLNSFLSSPPISLAGVEPLTAVLEFDSSWRPYANMTATVSVSYDGGTPVEVIRWASAGWTGGDPPADPDFKPDLVFIDEPGVTAGLFNPVGAQSMVITWGLTDAGNDWWWAFDNVKVSATTRGGLFRITGIAPSQESGNLVIEWASSPDAIYSIETSADLKEWIELEDGVESQGATTHFEVLNLSAFQNLYMRVRKQ